MLFIYLPVSSFEHHSKGSMSDQVFSAVLKISHCLHRDELMVQLMLSPGVDSSERCSPLQNIILEQNDPLSPGAAAARTAALFHDRLL